MTQYLNFQSVLVKSLGLSFEWMAIYTYYIHRYVIKNFYYLSFPFIYWETKGKKKTKVIRILCPY